MRTIILFISLFISLGAVYAQEKTDDELMREYKELLQKNRELLQKKQKQQEKEVEPTKIKKNKKLPEDSLTVKPDIKPIVKPETEPAVKPAVIPDAKPAEKPIVKPEIEPVKPTVVPDIKPAEKPQEFVVLESKTWSLEACIQYAIDHNISIKQLYLQREEADIQMSTAKNSRLPDLNASAENEWRFGRAENLTGTFEDKHLSTSTFSVRSSIPVFTGFRIPNRIARTRLEFEAATQSLEKAKEDLSLNITSLFLQALLFKELFDINEKQLELSHDQVERTKLLVRAGSIPKSQLSDIEAQVAKDKTAVVDARNNHELALLDLAQSLELEKEEDFNIYAPDFSGNIISEFLSSLQPPALIYENALNIKPVIKEQELRVESSRKGLKIAQAGYYPQLDFSMGLGTQYNYFYKPKEQTNPITSELIHLNRPLKNQIRDYGSQLISLSLSIPIFNRFQVRNQVRSARVDILNQQLILENNKKALYKEIQTAHKNALAAMEKYKAAEQAVKATSESFSQSQKRYEMGKASVFEFNEAKTRLIQSKAEHTQAKYEYILRTKILDFYNGIPIRF